MEENKTEYLVSIIMPSYNSEQFIRNSILSVLNQSFSLWELLIVDDASTDSTIDIIMSFEDPRIRVIRLNENKGNYYARNIGLENAVGKYIAMLDSDDISLPKRIQLQYNYLENNTSIGAIGTSFIIIDENGNYINKIDRRMGYSELRVNLIHDNILLHSSLFIKKELIERYDLKYQTSYLYAADYDFVFNCSKHFPVASLGEYCVLYRFHGSNITNTFNSSQKSFATIIRKNIITYYFGSMLEKMEIEMINSIFTESFDMDLWKIFRIEDIIKKILEFNYENKVLDDQSLCSLFNKRFVSLYSKYKKRS
jgi:glycosyltransferase involved in cell wall biosynthesis